METVSAVPTQPHGIETVSDCCVRYEEGHEKAPQVGH